MDFGPPILADIPSDVYPFWRLPYKNVKQYETVYEYNHMAITYSRVWTNRVRLPILLVVS